MEVRQSGIRYRVRRFYEYKLCSIVELLRRREIGFLLGILCEKATKYNPYLYYLRTRFSSTLVSRTVLGHQMLLDLSDHGISRRLFIRRVHEKDASRAFLNELRGIRQFYEGDVRVIEAGANIGYYVLLESDVLGAHGTIYAFEPSTDNRRLLARNLDRNDCSSDVRIIESALGDDEGTAVFDLSSQSNWSRIRTGGGDAPNDRGDDIVSSEEVDIQSIDHFLETEGIDPHSIAAVRMDLEGYETAVISGMQTLLDASHPMVLFVEIHPDFVAECTLWETIDRLDDAGFEIEFAQQDWKQLQLSSIYEILSVRGSHVRLVLSRRN